MTQTAISDIRQQTEAQEQALLHPLAAKSALSAGRHKSEEPCHIRTAFQRDRDRILHSKAFRRLKHKTQVFISPKGDHYRTRLTHSLEVAQVARTIARALKLNEDLTEAIALAHDLGHPPFGHTGELVLNNLVQQQNETFTFEHEAQSVRIATILEPLNLTKETLEGLSSQAALNSTTILEAMLVKVADRITYLHHDMEDASRAGLIKEDDVPEKIKNVLGNNRQKRLDTLVTDLIQQTGQALAIKGTKAAIKQSKACESAMNQLRKWMFENVYLHPSQQQQKENVDRALTGLFHYYLKHPNDISAAIPKEEPTALRALDQVAGMTDSFALSEYARLLLPSSNHIEGIAL